MKFVCKGIGYFFRIAMQQMKIFSERKGGMSLNGISINRCE